MPPRLNDDDDDSGNVVHEEGMNEMLTCFFGDGNNDDNNDHMVDNTDDSGKYHHRNVDDNNLKDSIKQASKKHLFKSGASRTSKLACTLILLEIKSLFGWSEKVFTMLLK